MFGYVLPARDKLSEEELQRFQSVYCGLCFALGERCGFVSRFLLNYDFTFLAILLSPEEGGECAQCRCAAHPFRKRCVAKRNEALDHAADLSIVLAWWQLCDHVEDKRFLSGLKYRAAKLLLKRSYRKAKSHAPDFDRRVEQHLKELAAVESSCCKSIDAAAEPFAALMAALAAEVEDERKRRILEQIFYHLGRWIYLIDAADDLEEDYKNGEYNPLHFRYRLTGGMLPPEAKNALAETLDMSISQMASAYELWDFGVWKPILNSVFYAGLYAVGNSVLEGTFHRAKRTKPQKLSQGEKE